MECLCELLECHARLDVTDKNGETVFHYAVRGSNPEIIKVREKQGALELGAGYSSLQRGKGERKEPSALHLEEIETRLSTPGGEKTS